MTMVATGYSPYEGSSTGRCATGMRAGYGVVAVDPRVIRLGTRLFVEGYGYAVAGDTGGAIKGARIDLGHTTYREAEHVGRRVVHVWVLDQSR
jgi:3D (Asp-Asp-Asp) domain-containing protein